MKHAVLAPPKNHWVDEFCSSTAPARYLALEGRERFRRDTPSKSKQLKISSADAYFFVAADIAFSQNHASFLDANESQPFLIHGGLRRLAAESSAPAICSINGPMNAIPLDFHRYSSRLRIRLACPLIIHVAGAPFEKFARNNRVAFRLCYVFCPFGHGAGTGASPG